MNWVNGYLVAGIGAVLIAVGLVFGNFLGVHIEHTVTAVNILSATGSYLSSIIIAPRLHSCNGWAHAYFWVKKKLKSA